MSSALSSASAVLSVLLLALGFALHGLWAVAAVVFAAGALWLLGQWRGLPWASAVGLVAQVIAAAVAMLNGVWGGWSVLAVVAALVAWDLDQFAQRMRAAGRVDDTPAQERRHIQRLLIVAGIGGLLALAAMGLKVRLSFGLALLLAVLMMLCLGLVIGYMRRAGD